MPDKFTRPIPLPDLPTAPIRDAAAPVAVEPEKAREDEEQMIDDDDFDPYDGDEYPEKSEPFGFCNTRDCTIPSEHYYPSECVTVADAIAWAQWERKHQRNLRRPPLPDPWRAAIRRAGRVRRRHGADHRLTRRAWARAWAARNRMHKRITPYFTKYRPTEDLPW